jgi:nitrite reductase/ring-hydroxylating ferredoxin subunit
MSVGYQAVGWNRQKRIYDAWLAAGVGAYLAAFVALCLWLSPEATLETLLIRAFGSAAFVLLHVTLSIGPLCRLDRRFLPLLYNRRHMGVTVFCLGLVHGLFALVQFHAQGDRPALVSLLSGEPGRIAWSNFPFQPLGFAALAILFLMAATSHDFWLANLGAPAWKRLHMLVYAAYALLVLHVSLGLLQSERSPWLAAGVGVGLVWVLGLHLVAGWRERAGDRERTAGAAGWVDACAVDAIPEGRARTVCIGGERVAVFRYGGRISALSNACKHQNGPLGEGRVIDGCVTCPWHGSQYRPADGASPPPFTEKVATYRVRLAGERVQVHAQALAPGTPVEPAVIQGGAARAEGGEFYVGYLPRAPVGIARRTRLAIAAACTAGLCVAGVFAFAQKPFGDGVFEYGRPQSFTGVLRAAPAPLLEVVRPGRVPSSSAAQGVSQLVLVAEGKHGFEVGALAGARVELSATPIHRDGATLLEVQAGSVAVLAPAAPARAPAVERLGRLRLVGEVVDSKCWLGVMKPGSSKVHRACAIRCLSGGIPPALLVRDKGGAARTFLLLDAQGRTLGREVLPFVALPVEVEGEVERHGELLVLRSDPAAWRRL